MDIDSAFLYGNLEEEIYMEQPEGFFESGKEDFVLTRKEPLEMEETMDMILEEAERNDLHSKTNALSAQAQAHAAKMSKPAKTR